MYKIPRQKLPRSRKTKDWNKQCIEAFINRSVFGSQRSADILNYYAAYNGNIDESSYHYVTNPYNSEANARKYFPAKLRNYNIIKPIVDLLMGEKAKRPMSYQVVVKNADIENRFDKYRKQQFKAYLEQLVINELNKSANPTDVESQELPVPEEHAEAVFTNYRDSRAIIGQEALNYLRDWLSLDDKFQKLFFDWLVAGEVVTYKDVDNNDIIYEVLSCLDFDYEASPDTEFIEDADWCVRRNVLSVNAVIDRFYDQLSSSDIDALENPEQSPETGGGSFIENVANPNASPDSDRMVEVMHVCWKTFARVGILSYVDEFGQPQELVVDESYKKTEEDEIKWYWVNEVREGYRINKDIYVQCEPHKVQRNQMNNISVCKLPYNGRIYSNRFSEPISIVGLGMPYQILYNVFHYRLELSIAKNKDKIMLMEMNTIPKRNGWDEEKFMYYADAMGFAFIDSTAEGRNRERVSFNQYQVLDMSLGQYIEAQFRLLMAIKEEWEEMVGVSRQRKGNIAASDAVGATERAIFQSSTISEEIFRRFEVFLEKEYQGLLDTSKIAWRSGKKMTYVTSDLRTAIISIDPDEYQEAEYGIFVKNNAQESSKLEQLRQLANSFAQNGQMPSTIAEILDSNNFAHIKSLLNEVDEKQKALEQQTQQQQMQMQQQQVQAQQQMQAEQHKFTMEEAEKDRELQLELKRMDMAMKITQDADGNGRRDAIDQQRLDVEREKVQVQKEKSRYNNGTKNA